MFFPKPNANGNRYKRRLSFCFSLLLIQSTSKTQNFKFPAFNTHTLFNTTLFYSQFFYNTKTTTTTMPSFKFIALIATAVLAAVPTMAQTPPRGRPNHADQFGYPHNLPKVCLTRHAFFFCLMLVVSACPWHSTSANDPWWLRRPSPCQLGYRVPIQSVLALFFCSLSNHSDYAQIISALRTFPTLALSATETVLVTSAAWATLSTMARLVPCARPFYCPFFTHYICAGPNHCSSLLLRPSMLNFG